MKPTRLLRSCASISLPARTRSEEHTSELQSRLHLVCRLLLEKKKKAPYSVTPSDWRPLNKGVAPISCTVIQSLPARIALTTVLRVNRLFPFPTASTAHTSELH